MSLVRGVHGVRTTLQTSRKAFSLFDSNITRYDNKGPNYSTLEQEEWVRTRHWVRAGARSALQRYSGSGRDDLAELVLVVRRAGARTTCKKTVFTLQRSLCLAIAS